jgi:hypothetical protein
MVSCNVELGRPQGWTSHLQHWDILFSHQPPGCEAVRAHTLPNDRQTTGALLYCFGIACIDDPLAVSSASSTSSISIRTPIVKSLSGRRALLLCSHTRTSFASSRFVDPLNCHHVRYR